MSKEALREFARKQAGRKNKGYKKISSSIRTEEPSTKKKVFKRSKKSFHSIGHRKKKPSMFGSFK